MRWLRWTAIALAAIAVSEVVAGRALKRAENWNRSLFDRQNVDYMIDASRLHLATNGVERPLRLAIIGDSLSYGRRVFFYDAFGPRLERLLNLNPGVLPAVVDVYARDGTTTSQQYQLFNLALTENPDLVLFMVSLNDVEDKRNKKEVAQWLKKIEPYAPPAWLSRGLAWSRTYAWALKTYRAASERKGVIEYFHHIFEPTGKGWQRFTEAIVAFRDTCAQRGIAMAVVILPPMDRLGNYPFQFAHLQLQNFFREARVPSLDLLADFETRAPERMMAIPGQDGHLSEIAHRIAADGIFEFLIGTGFVSDAYVPVHMPAAGTDFIQRCRQRAPAWTVPNAPESPPARPPDEATSVSVRAKLAAMAMTPPPESIKPYKNALVVYVYEVERVEAGLPPAESRIAVAHWGIRDENTVDIGRRIGESYAMTLERFADHPELEGEHQVIEDADVHLPLYYETGK
jgi:lysophospholipase L1-like esterase